MRELRPGDVVGDYVCEHELRSGGMAQLFVARAAKRPRRKVVIKRILPSLGCDEDLLRMFAKEARVGRALRHRNIARVLGSGVFEEGPYIVVEHIEGADLRRLLKRAVRDDGCLSLGVSLGVAIEVARALDHAHTEGHVVHRDVDPSNVLIATDGAVKLVDFGIARTMAVTHTTRASWIKGKAGYMAPEQCLGMHLDRRTDIFALGILLYEMTTGYRLFHGPTDYETTRRILSGEYVPPSEAVEGYPPALERIIVRALETDPDERWPTAAAMTVALLEFARDHDVVVQRSDRAAAAQALRPPPSPASTRRSILLGAALALPVVFVGFGALLQRSAPARVAAQGVAPSVPTAVELHVPPTRPPDPPPQRAPSPAAESPPALQPVAPPHPARKRPRRKAPTAEAAPPADSASTPTPPVAASPVTATLLPPSRRTEEPEPEPGSAAVARDAPHRLRQPQPPTTAHRARLASAPRPRRATTGAAALVSRCPRRRHDECRTRGDGHRHGPARGRAPGQPDAGAVRRLRSIRR